MGSGIAKHAPPVETVATFAQACEWYMNGDDHGEIEVYEYLARTMEVVERNAAQWVQESREHNDEESGLGKGNDIRQATSTVDHTILSINPHQYPAKAVKEYFEDSVYAKNWLSKLEADLLFGEMCQIGLCESRKRLAVQDWKKTKYPIWTMTFGLQRELDGAYALDRWGSYHENWCKLQKAPKSLEKICKMINKDFEDENGVVNSLVVNFYWEGESTFIPAHRDTVACLENTSKIYCLSLGASRDFVLCGNDDAGKFIKSDMSIAKEWRVNHGDLFALGQESNIQHCHAVPQEADVKDLRVSIIFRCVDKSFLDLHAPAREVTYASGNVKEFSAACITTECIDDIGIQEHIADLIAKRELTKLKKVLVSKRSGSTAQTYKGCDDDKKQANKIIKQQDTEDLRKFFMGEGSTVPHSPLNDSSASCPSTIITSSESSPMPEKVSPLLFDVEIEKREEAKRKQIAYIVQEHVDNNCSLEGPGITQQGDKMEMTVSDPVPDSLMHISNPQVSHTPLPIIREISSSSAPAAFMPSSTRLLNRVLRRFDSNQSD